MLKKLKFGQLKVKFSMLDINFGLSKIFEKKKFLFCLTNLILIYKFCVGKKDEQGLDSR